MGPPMPQKDTLAPFTSNAMASSLTPSPYSHPHLHHRPYPHPYPVPWKDLVDDFLHTKYRDYRLVHT